MKRSKTKPQERNFGAVCTVLAAAGLALSPFMSGNMNFYALAIPLYLVCLGAYIYFGRKQVSDKAEFPPFLLYSFLAVLVYSLAVMLFYSPNRYLSAVSVIGFIGMICACLISSRMARDRNAALYLALAALAGAALCSAKAVALALALDGSRLFSGGVPRVFGGFVNPNFFAGFLTLVIPVGVALLFAFRTRLIRTVIGAAVFLSLGALLLTASKFGIAGLAFGLAALLVMTFGYRKAIGIKGYLAVLVILAISFGLFGAGLAGRVAGAREGGSETHSAGFRVYTWKSAARMCLAHPVLGVGPGRFEEAYPRYTVAGLTTHAHNSYLQFACEYGIPCGLLVLAWIAFALISGAGALRRPEELPVTDLAECTPEASAFVFAGILAGCCGLLFHSLADSDLHTGASALCFAVFAGALLGLAPKTTREAPFAKTLLERCTLLCMLVIFVFGFSDYSVHAKRYETALRMTPINSAAWMGYAADTETASIARARLKNAVREAPQSFTACLRLADFVNMEHPGSKEAQGLYKKTLTLHPHSLTAMKRLAEIGVEKGDNLLADKYYQKLLDVEQTPYEQVKGVPEMVNTSYCDAHAYFADKALMEQDEALAEKHLQAAADRYQRWLSNGDYILIALISGLLSVPEFEDNKVKYLEITRLLGDLRNESTSSSENEINKRFDEILKKYSSLSGGE